MTRNAKLFGSLPLGWGLLAAGALAVTAPLQAQTDDPVVRLVADPPELAMRVGDEAQVTVTGITRSGARVDDPAVRLVGPRLAMRVREGTVTALTAGEFALIATLIPADGEPGGAPVTLRVPVTIDWPAVARVVVAPTSDTRLLVGTTVRLIARAEHGDGSARPAPDVEWRSGTPDVATVDRFGRVTAVAPGTATIAATVEGVEGTATLSADPFTGQSLEIVGGVTRARTGDVVDFGAEVRDGDGQLLTGVPSSGPTPTRNRTGSWPRLPRHRCAAAVLSRTSRASTRSSPTRGPCPRAPRSASSPGT